MDLDGFSVTVVGLGLIGGSFAMALKELKPKNIWGIDRVPEVLEKVRNSGIIDEGFTSPEGCLEKSDLVIIALYPENTVQFIRQNMSKFKSGAIITDTAGIKGTLVREVQSFLRGDLDFIGGHPMAGKTENGFVNAEKGLFRGANYILTPTDENKEENVAFLTSLAYGMGCRKVIELTPEEHDRAIALTSHLPHVIAVSIIDSVGSSENIPSLVGGSFRDATRVAVLNSELWCELLESNSENIVSTIEIFEESLSRMKNAILKKDENYLKSKFKDAYVKRKEIG